MHVPYFGGWGLIAHYLLQELEPGTDPLGPDNLLIFATGVVTGAPAGWDSSIFELMKAGERALALARAFNYREGFTAQDDVAHWRFSTPFESGPKQGTKVPAEDIAQALDLYYEMRGWDKETGAPTTGKLHELGIGWVAELLYGG